jgi:precorrin-2 dehydrogenase / sirohydrochlorin ferrochelatase
MSQVADVPMYPIMLNVSGLAVFVIGDDSAADERAATLAGHGASQIMRFPNLAPTAADFAKHAPRLVFMTNTSGQQRAEIHELAKDVGALVHAQDYIPLCDFHLPARLRRGRMLITVSTDGTVAGLSRLLRDYLATNVFGVEWGIRVDELAAARRHWKTSGLSMGTLFQAISDHVAEKGWLPRRASEH